MSKKNGVVFLGTETGNKNWLFFGRCSVVKMCHDEQGHFALDKTLRKFTAKYIKSCLKCLYYNSTSGKKLGLIYPIEKKAIPFDTLYLDHEGPYIKNKNIQVITMMDHLQSS